MQGKYRKIMIPMERENESHQFWKVRTEEPVCYVETYKDKRAVFFHGSNLLPGVNYHLILIGGGSGQMEHQDFGPLHTGANGELQCYRTFGGKELEAYEFCLLCAEGDEQEMEIVYKGSLFGKETAWATLCDREQKIKVFTEECDETGAEWVRVEDLESPPQGAACCLPWIKVYGHYIIGRKGQQFFLGVPGRFLQKEQPLREDGIFLLWQPMRGGEDFFDRPDRMSRQQQEKIFGYWIAEVDVKKNKLRPL